MKILLLSATQMEVETYLLSSPHHDVLIGGVGGVSTAYRLTRQLSHHHYDLVIQAGIAGRFSKSFARIGDVVEVSHDAFGDLGAWQHGYRQSVQDMELSTEPEWISHPNLHVPPLGLPVAKSITVNTVSDSAEWANALVDKWHADLETMEGAAAAFVCAQKQIPFVQIRAVSNQVGVRNKAEWQMGMALANLNEVIAAVVAKLHPL